MRQGAATSLAPTVRPPLGGRPGAGSGIAGTLNGTPARGCVLSRRSRGSVYVRAKIGAKHFLMSGTTPLHDFEMKAAQYIVKFIRVASVGE